MKKLLITLILTIGLISSSSSQIFVDGKAMIEQKYILVQLDNTKKNSIAYIDSGTKTVGTITSCNNEIILFNSPADVLNYLFANGYEFKNAPIDYLLFEKI